MKNKWNYYLHEWKEKQWHWNKREEDKNGLCREYERVEDGEKTYKKIYLYRLNRKGFVEMKNLEGNQITLFNDTPEGLVQVIYDLFTRG